ncbi:breast cancer type 1 susceptibility protein isoform X4 [Vombatus ursinus]|uniref:breast cancer type 1 susceptibility protein isoform X4 n=1 Tax=Vombatus ursinus TaxID=29139 RepID=UPI000FFD07D4|nr:breast cancer type 1 susceptibility protein isoform X4 [Vombatus ursinus]
MDLSTVSIEEVKNVLLEMQKILECPICLELIKEPVSTTCDHIFCKFCMLKLLSKKKGPSQCPLCKDNITKRSLRESTRFNQLVDGLLKTIRAFELDTGFQFSNSQDFSKWEKRTPEPLKKEAAIIQSMGYRNRTKRFRASEPENPTSASSLGVQLFDLGIRKGSLRRKQKKCVKNNAVYIELGSDSSEDGVKNAVCNSVEDQELCQTSPQGTRHKVRLKPRGKGDSASGYDSETSHPGDISQLSFQSDILTTQQRDTMQDNLKKLQQEMAVLEAVLEQHGSQTSNRPTSQEPGLCPSVDQPGLKQTKSEKGAEKTVEYHKSENAQRLSAYNSQAFPEDSSSKNEEPGVEGSSLLKSQMLNGDWSLLGHSRILQKVESSSEEGISRIAILKEKQQRQPEEQSVVVEQSCVLKPNLETAPESESGVKVYPEKTKCGPQENKDTTLRNILNLPTSTSALRSSQLQIVKSTNTSASNTPARSVRGQLEEACASERVRKGGTGILRMSFVASSLTPKEHMLVQKFARKTQSTLSNQFTEGTTHVIMKTDAEFVCERTLKYFLGIAGGKWVVSFLWVVQSFKEGKVLPECDFEVRGDVINGRNHRGPERARESQRVKIFKGLEICCYGPFTDMPTDHLEWMVQLCGASVVKKPSSLRPRVGFSPVVVVQPDAWEDDSSFQGIRLMCEAPIVTREWVLDSVSCYQRQELDSYLMSQPSSDCC